MVNKEFFEQFLQTFQNIEVFDPSARFVLHLSFIQRLVAQFILLEVLRTICREEPSLYRFCMDKHLISTLLSAKFLIPLDSTHFTCSTDDSMERCVNEKASDLDRVCIFGNNWTLKWKLVREAILDLIFDLLRHSEESTYLYELSTLLQAMAADSFDELFIISVVLHI